MPLRNATWTANETSFLPCSSKADVYHDFGIRLTEAIAFTIWTSPPIIARPNAFMGRVPTSLASNSRSRRPDGCRYNPVEAFIFVRLLPLDTLALLLWLLARDTLAFRPRPPFPLPVATWIWGDSLLRFFETFCAMTDMIVVYDNILFTGSTGESSRQNWINLDTKTNRRSSTPHGMREVFYDPPRIFPPIWTRWYPSARRVVVHRPNR